MLSTGTLRAGLRSKSVRGALHTATSNIAEFVLRLGSTMILARLILPEDYGVMGMVLAVTTIAEQFRDLGLSAATVQRAEITHEQVTNLFWINAAAGVIIAMAVGAAAPLVSAFYGDPRLTVITVLMGTNFIWSGLAVQHQSLMRRQMQLGRLALLSLGTSLLSTGVAIALAWRGHAYWALAWREVSRALFFALGAWMCCPWRPGRPSRGSQLGSLLRFGRDMTATQLLVAMIANVDRLLVGKLFGAVPLGLYRQAQGLVMAPFDQLLSPIMAVAQPGLSALQTEPDRYRRYYRKIVLIVAMATMPLGVFIAVNASEITSVVLGEKWRGAASFMWIFAVAAAIRPVIATSGVVLVTCGRTGAFFVVATVHSVVLMIFMLVGSRFDAKGIAVAQVLTTVVLAVPKLHYSFRTTPVTLRLFWSALSAPTIAALAMGVVLLSTRGCWMGVSEFQRLALGAVVGVVTFCGMGAALPTGRSMFHELQEDLSSLLRRNRRVPVDPEMVRP